MDRSKDFVESKFLNSKWIEKLSNEKLGKWVKVLCEKFHQILKHEAWAQLMQNKTKIV